MEKYKKTVTVLSGGVFRHARVLPGRNRPCICGSGKKFKKCCLEGMENPTRELVIAAGIKTEERLKNAGHC